MGVNNRREAAYRAAELGLLASEGPAPPVPAPPPSRSPIRYVANEGVHIAYQVVGDRPIDLLFIPGFLSHLELAWEDPEYTTFFSDLARDLRVILFDKRGVGVSDRTRGAPTLEMTMSDACGVLDAVGSQSAFVMGTSEGGAAATLLAAMRPERVRGLILYGAIPKAVQTDHEPPWASPEATFDDRLELMRESWGGPWAIERFAPSRAHDLRFRDWWARVLRAASSPSSVKAVMSLLREVDVRPLLPQIRVKSLVMHRTGDRVARVEAGRYFATHLPGATWIELPGEDHVFFIDSGAIRNAITAFCRQTPPHRPADTWVAVILHAIPIDPRLAASRLRASITACAPRTVTILDDGALALFDGPNRAVECARRLRATAGVGGVRIGLHVGECRIADGQPVRAVMEVARAAAHRVAPGEIAVTHTCATSWQAPALRSAHLTST